MPDLTGDVLPRRPEHSGDEAVQRPYVRRDLNPYVLKGVYKRPSAVVYKKYIIGILTDVIKATNQLESVLQSTVATMSVSERWKML